MSTEDKAVGWLLVGVSAAFALVIWPFFGAVLWAVVFAIVCGPLFRRLRRVFRGRGSLAAMATLVLIVVVVIVPMTLVAASMVREASDLYRRKASRRRASSSPCRRSTSARSRSNSSSASA